MLTKIDAAILAWLGLLGLLLATAVLLAQLQEARPALASMRDADAGRIGMPRDADESDRNSGQELWARVRPNLIAAQRKCPVADERLPEDPAWTVVGSRVVFVCCPPCGRKVEAEPKKYLSVVDEYLDEDVLSRKA